MDFVSYACLSKSLWPNKNWKNKKIATLNVICLLYGNLMTNCSCYCDSLGWYLSKNNFYRIFNLFLRLKIIAWNHYKINFFWLSTLIFWFHPGYLLSKLYFSKTTARVLSESTIRTRRYLGWEKIFVYKVSIKCMSIQQ